VKISETNVEEIAAFLAITPDQFIQDFTRIRVDRQGLALADKPNDECIFLEGKSCRIQSVKPRQCSEFPNLWNFPGFEKVCQAIPHELTEPEYRKRINQSLAPSPFKSQKEE
jgi:Fe-S-cluster containining protein